MLMADVQSVRVFTHPHAFASSFQSVGDAALRDPVSKSLEFPDAALATAADTRFNDCSVIRF
jgi:hypothetical protein